MPEPHALGDVSGQQLAVERMGLSYLLHTSIPYKSRRKSNYIHFQGPAVSDGCRSCSFDAVGPQTPWLLCDYQLVPE